MLIDSQIYDKICFRKVCGWEGGFFPATARKLNESAELKRLGIEFSTIIPYRTAKNAEKKFEDLGTACIQDRMSQREKELVNQLFP